MLACPYGAIEIILTTKTKTIGGVTYTDARKPYVLKCDLCATNAAGPVCVSKCLTQTLKLVDDKSLKATTKDRRIKAAEASGAAAVQISLV
jgi:electron transport protein HydN